MRKVLQNNPFLDYNFKKYYDLYQKALDFAVEVNITSYNKYSPPSLKSSKNIVSRGCLHKIDETAVIMHRAILSLCVSGWASMSPILLRSMFECLTNTLAILNPKDNSDFMGFKFCSLDFLNTMVATDDKKIFEYHNFLIQREIKKMNGRCKEMADKYVEEFLKQKEQKTWWFKPEYKSIEHILLKSEVVENLYEIYKMLSKSTHSTYIGFGLFKDKPDRVDINPRYDIQSAKQAIVMSSRLLIEICNMRNEFEELGCNSQYKRLFKELVSLREDVESSNKS